MTDKEHDSGLIELELSEDEVAAPPKPKAPERKPGMFSMAQAGKKPAEDSTVQIADILAGLNAEYKEYQTLMPFSTTLVLEDLEKRRLFAMQIAVKGQNTDAVHYVLITGAGRLDGQGASFRLDKADCGGDMVLCIKKFKQMFRDKTMNEWEDRGCMLEIPGYYKLYGAFSFALHGSSVPTVSDDKKHLLNTITFVKLKVNSYSKQAANDRGPDIAQLVDFSTVSSVLAALGVSEEFYVDMTSRKISQVWKIVSHMSKELAKLSPNSKHLTDLSAELGGLLKLTKESQVLSKIELRDMVEKVKMIQDLNLYKEFVEQLSSSVATEEAYRSFKGLNGISCIKAITEEEEFARLKGVFDSAVEAGHRSNYVVGRVSRVELSSFDGCFTPFLGLERRYLWKAIAPTSLPSLISNACFYYEKEPLNASYLDLKGIKLYDSPHRAIEQVPAAGLKHVYCVLVEVAVGSCFGIDQDTMKDLGGSFFHSLKVEGKNQPMDSQTLDGVEMLGNIQQVESPAKKAFMYNEYIVLDKNQYVPRYLLEVDISN